MGLNCKPGCLAIVVGGIAGGNIGKIVTCIKYVGNADKLVGTPLAHKDNWLVDIPLNFVSTGDHAPRGSFPYCTDSYLRMLNDPDFTEGSNTDTQLTHKEKDHV